MLHPQQRRQSQTRNRRLLRITLPRDILSRTGIFRRHLTVLLPLLALALADTAKAQKFNLPSKTYVFEDLPVKQNGPNFSRAIMNGANHSGVPFEMHGWVNKTEGKTAYYVVALGKD